MSIVVSPNLTSTKAVITASSVALVFGGNLSSASMVASSSGGVVSVNTQARRLGCLVYLLGLVSRGRKIESLLLSLSVSEVASLKHNINANGYTSGHLTATTSSVRHYVDAALAFHLLVQQGAVFDLSVRSRFLLDAIKPDSRQPYPLHPETKVFFLHTLLGFDYFGIAAIIRSLLSGASKMSEIQREHQSELLQLLETVSRTSTNTRLQRSMRDRVISIRNWKKPESYCEHLIAAKLNWLADLGILNAPPSSTSGISLTSGHQDWLSDWAAATEPTEVNLLTLLLRYAQVAVPRTNSQKDTTLCSALQLSFDRLSNPGKLAKIRLPDFILFLVCFQPHFLAQLVTEAKSLFLESVVNCGSAVYKIHSASRSTQSYIVREEIAAR